MYIVEKYGFFSWVLYEVILVTIEYNQIYPKILDKDQKLPITPYGHLSSVMVSSQDIGMEWGK